VARQLGFASRARDGRAQMGDLQSVRDRLGRVELPEGAVDIRPGEPGARELEEHQGLAVRGSHAPGEPQRLGEMGPGLVPLSHLRVDGAQVADDRGDGALLARLLRPLERPLAVGERPPVLAEVGVHAADAQQE
jgi:hypothetical protein